MFGWIPTENTKVNDSENNDENSTSQENITANIRYVGFINVNGILNNTANENEILYIFGI